MHVFERTTAALHTPPATVSTSDNHQRNSGLGPSAVPRAAVKFLLLICFTQYNISVHRLYVLISQAVTDIGLGLAGAEPPPGEGGDDGGWWDPWTVGVLAAIAGAVGCSCYASHRKDRHYRCATIRAIWTSPLLQVLPSLKTSVRGGSLNPQLLDWSGAVARAARCRGPDLVRARLRVAEIMMLPFYHVDLPPAVKSRTLSWQCAGSPAASRCWVGLQHRSVMLKADE